MKGIAARLWAWLRRTTLASAGALRSFAVWVSPLPRLIPALLIAVFALSLLAWAFLDRQSSYVLYFPDHRGKTFGGELRDLPWRSTAEDRAELLVSEFLLGPRDPRLLPASSRSSSGKAPSTSISARRRPSCPGPSSKKPSSPSGRP